MWASSKGCDSSPIDLSLSVDTLRNNLILKQISLIREIYRLGFVKSTGIWKKDNGRLSDPEEDAPHQAAVVCAPNGLIQLSADAHIGQSEGTS
jgi:hypothetical protein